jgi:cob(I)alamin adenosyltransferase
MKIYTKKGDRGETSLIGGKRVPKNHIRVEAYGTVDELISSLGILRAYEQEPYYGEFLLSVQNTLMNISARLAAEGDIVKKLPEISTDEVSALESEIDKITATLPALGAFVIPGGNVPEAFAHLSRCICRRAERIVVALQDNSLPEPLLEYINRLSDFLFVYARKQDRDRNTKDTVWGIKN